jgi:hypothetical protein
MLGKNRHSQALNICRKETQRFTIFVDLRQSAVILGKIFIPARSVC